jgi:putative pyruvate formate lyase activating enzyme
VPQILAALPAAIEGGLRVPLVYNSSGYERVEVLSLLEGLVEVWLLDAKYAESKIAQDLSGFRDYVQNNRLALQEVYRQVGAALALDAEGLVKRGMIVRHLVLPHGLAGTTKVLRWVSEALSPQVHVSLMDQYFPAYRTVGDPILGYKVTSGEYAAAQDAFHAAGLGNGWCQNTLLNSDGD